MIQTATYDWNFLTDGELWEFGGTGGWTATDGWDGVSAPGCLYASRFAGASFDYGAEGFGTNLQNYWDFMGIPHTATIIRGRASCWWKIPSVLFDPDPTVRQYRFRLLNSLIAGPAIHAGYLIQTTQVTDAPSPWFFASAESDYTCNNYALNSYMGFLCITDSPSISAVDGRMDTLHWEVDYIDNFQGCCTFRCLGGPGGFTITPSGSGPITYVSSDSWVHSISGPSSGAGDVTFTVDSNAGGVGRLATITVNDEVFYIIQKSNC